MSRRQANYDAYLRSFEWRVFRSKWRRHYRQSLGREPACQVCGASRVELHHLTYARLGRERFDDVVPLCRPCHRKSHGLVAGGGSALEFPP
jgi:5-methylcytosine-specific restriction endonuclease McrA